MSSSTLLVFRFKMIDDFQFYKRPRSLVKIIRFILKKLRP